MIWDIEHRRDFLDQQADFRSLAPEERQRKMQELEYWRYWNGGNEPGVIEPPAEFLDVVREQRSRGRANVPD